MPKLRQLFAFTVIFKLMFAYLDPGTGSLLIQLLIGAVMGFVFIFRNSVKSLLYFFGLRKPPATEDDSIEDIDAVQQKTDDNQ